jgi:VWFA-related protein
MRTSALTVVFSIGAALAGAAASQSAPSTGPGPTIRATVNEVALDIVVRDKHGKLVKNISPADVQIYEDGKPQKLLSFRLAEGSGVSQGQPGSAPGGAAANAETRPGTPPALPLRKANLVCIVLHNQDNVDVSMKKFTLQAIAEFLQNKWDSDTWAGIFSLGSNLKVLYPFTKNRNELLQAVGNGSAGGSFQLARLGDAALRGGTNMDVGGSFQLSRMADAVLNGTPNMDVIVGNGSGFTETLQTGTLNPAAILDVQDETGLAAGAQRGDLVDQQRELGHIQGMRSIDQVKTMIRGLASLPGHKTVLLLSAGLPSNGDADLFESVLKAARQADISVYALDTNGLSLNSNALAANQDLQYATSVSQQQQNSTYDNYANQTTNTPNGKPAPTYTVGSAGREAELVRQDDFVHNAVRQSDTQAPLRALSEGTGGFLIGGGNDLRKPYQQLIADIGTHYEAVYRPASAKYDGHLRKIEVKLARADLTVESRTGYFAVPYLGGEPLMPFEMAGLMALNGKPAPHSFDFRSAAYQFRPEGPANQIGVAFEVPASSVTATAEPTRKIHRLHVAVVAMVKDAGGQIVERFGQDSPFEIPDDKMPMIEKLPITWTHAFDLPAGNYTVETVILDRESNRASTAVLPFFSPGPVGIGLSSVMLVRRMAAASGEAKAANPFEFGADRVIPLLNATLSKDAQPNVYFVVYPNPASTEPTMVGFQFYVNGKLVTQQASAASPADATGAIPVVMPAMVKPGECELRITAIQGFASATQSVRYTVSAE